MQFNLLGPIQVVDKGHVRTPSSPKQRTVLSLLLLRSNELVSTEALVEELWRDRSPPSAMSTLQTYIYQLRKMFLNGNHDPHGQILLTKTTGYLLRLQPVQLDIHHFGELARQGREALADGRTERASTLLHKALNLWRGPALADVEAGPRLEAHITRLHESRLSVLEQRIEADLRLGRHRELIGELKALAAEHPFHEWFYMPLMVALSLSGRRWEALEVYRVLRRVLREELGLEPSVAVERLQQAILSGTTDHSFELLHGVRSST